MTLWNVPTIWDTEPREPYCLLAVSNGSIMGPYIEDLVRKDRERQREIERDAEERSFLSAPPTSNRRGRPSRPL